MTIKQEMALQ